MALAFGAFRLRNVQFSEVYPVFSNSSRFAASIGSSFSSTIPAQISK